MPVRRLNLAKSKYCIVFPVKTYLKVETRKIHQGKTVLIFNFASILWNQIFAVWPFNACMMHSQHFGMVRSRMCTTILDDCISVAPLFNLKGVLE